MTDQKGRDQFHFYHFDIYVDCPPEEPMTVALPLMLACALTYSLLSLLAAVGYLRSRPPRTTATEPISILKPLAGLDDGLESNLRAFFEQDYPAFEILICCPRSE